MHIGINGRSFLKKQITGIGRYASHLVKALGEIDDEHQYSVYTPLRFFDRKRKKPSFSAKNIHVRTDYFRRGIDQICSDIDLYHAPAPEIIETKRNIPVCMNVHDIIHKVFPQGHTKETIELTDRIFTQSHQPQPFLFFISEHTRQDYQQYYPLDVNHSAVVHLGVDHATFFPEQPEEKEVIDSFLKTSKIPSDFLLAVCTIEPRKNLDNLLIALDLLKQRKAFRGKLVIVGMKGWMMDEFEQKLKKHSLADHVVLPGYLDTKQLRWLYNRANVFVFPSLYEGFGLPILESFACGTPVLTSTVSSCPEVAGEAGHCVDPHDPELIANGIEKLLADDDFRNEKVQQGLKRSQEFTFQETARKSLAIYKRLVVSDKS